MGVGCWIWMGDVDVEWVVGCRVEGEEGGGRRGELLLYFLGMG